jgi:hypothetical protein
MHPCIYINLPYISTFKKGGAKLLKNGAKSTFKKGGAKLLKNGAKSTFKKGGAKYMTIFIFIFIYLDFGSILPIILAPPFPKRWIKVDKGG